MSRSVFVTKQDEDPHAKTQRMTRNVVNGTTVKRRRLKAELQHIQFGDGRVLGTIGRSPLARPLSCSTQQWRICMRKTLVFAGLVIAAFLTEGARADGLIYQLPKDGASVRFDMELTTSRNGQDHTTKGIL